MNPRIEAILKAWFTQEINQLKEKGATDDMIREASPAFIELLLATRVLQHHSAEIIADKELGDALQADPDDLRKAAAIYRQHGKSDLAYDLEVLADQRERGTEKD